jgi:glycosyltransferase involved in cell wall biosynthesis
VGAAASAAAGPSVLLITEGTYPYVVGGVSSWCDLLTKGLPEVHWRVLPIVTSGRPVQPLFELPPNAELLPRLELWTESLPGRPLRRAGGDGLDVTIPARLATCLIAWDGDVGALPEALVYCRRNAARLTRLFRSKEAWRLFVEALEPLTTERGPAFAAPGTLFDLSHAVRLYHTLDWVARAAAAPTPRCDLLHVTAAGWAALPALVDRELYGTPVLLTEHGVYVREAYLAAVRTRPSTGDRFIATRLARGLARAAYAAADVVSPVAEANARWERGLGVDGSKIRVVYNGVEVGAPPTPLPGNDVVVSVGRIDPLKDIHTMLRVATEVTARLPDVRFLHYGPVSDGQEAYGRSCELLHEQLGLGERFRFMGSTKDPNGAVRAADVMVMTSISEALPLSILEAMVEGRPIVSTGVGGIPELISSCGIVAPPGDVNGLADAIVTLVRDRQLAQRLGASAYRAAASSYTRDACLDGYAELVHSLAAAA